MQSAPTLPTGAQVAVNWTNNATNATSVVLERAIGTGAFSVLATLPATGTSYTDTTVTPGPYSYQVRAIGAVGPSLYAGPVTVTVPQPASTTVVLSNPNPSLVGANVTFTATVSPALATGMPSGTVIFKADGATTSVPLDSLGVATFTTATLPAGANVITAAYGGDAVFTASTGSVTQTVNKTATTTVVVSSLNPSTVGGNVTFTATVSPSTATGTVSFTVDGVGTSVAIVAGQATLSTSLLASGAHAVQATYGGDTAFMTSTSTTLTQTVGPVLRPTATLVTGNRNPSANLGQSITFTATVRPATGTGTPTGTVQFNVDGVNVGGVRTMNAQGRAAYSTAALSAGSHNVIATYSGSAIFAGGGSATFIQAVKQAASTTLVTSNRNPSVFGQSLTLTARVSPSTARGTVQFILNGAAVGAPVTVDATGRATLITNTLSVGYSTVLAVYSGNVNYLPSTSANFIQTVNTATSRTVLVSSARTATRATTVVFTVTVTARAPGTGIPAGTVQFRIDGVNKGPAAPLNPSGQAAYQTSTLSVGRHNISAIYTSSGNFNASNSGNVTQRIR